MRRNVAIAITFLALVAGPVAAAPPSDLQYFTGTWHCGTERWTFAPFATNWMRIEYAHGDVVDGVAYAGYVAQLGTYVYRDFHADGSYADLHASPPTAAGVWTWTGPYYAAGQPGVQTGAITYTETDARSFARQFATAESDGTLTPHGGDVCTKDT